MPAIPKAIKLKSCKSLRTALPLWKQVLWFVIQLSSESQEIPFSEQIQEAPCWYLANLCDGNTVAQAQEVKVQVTKVTAMSYAARH